MKKERFRQHLIPNLGTILVVALLLLANRIADRVQANSQPEPPDVSSTSVFPYQGRLTDDDGKPVTGLVSMEFRIYDTPDGETFLWEELWTGPNAVQVTEGLFDVMLGSREPTLGSAVAGYDVLYLGITVNTDEEMEPRVQLGSVPFARLALTVPDGSITPAKAPFALNAPGYSMESGTTIITSDEQGFGYNFRTKQITFDTPFNGSCPVVVMTNTSQGWGIWGDRVISMAAIPTTTGFIAAIFRDDGAVVQNNPHVEWVAFGCR